MLKGLFVTFIHRINFCNQHYTSYMNQALWGIDLGGTKIEGVILGSIASPDPIVRTRVDTEA